MVNTSNAWGNEPKPNPVPGFQPYISRTNVERIGTILHEIQHDQEEPFVYRPHLRSQSDTAAMLRSYTITDAIGLCLGFMFAWGLALAVNELIYHRQLPTSFIDAPRMIQSLLIGGCTLLWFEHTSHYNVRFPFWIEMKKIVGAMGFAMLIDGFLQFASKHDFSRLWLISAWAFAAISIMAMRGIWRSILRRRGDWTLPTLLVSSGHSAEDVRLALASEPGMGYDVVAQIEDLQAAFKSHGSSWKQLCAAYKAEYVILAFTDLAKGEQALAQLMREDVPYSIAPSLYKAPVFGMVPQYFFNHDVMLLTHNHGLDRSLPCFVKRTFDLIVASFALIIMSPLLLLIALLVSLDGGPALFGHKRLGLNGKVFPCLKFRTMVTDSERVLKKHLEKNPEARAEWQKDYKLRNDPRVTRIGKFLRRTSLDEFPQFLNVIFGDMSIVGPRPIIVAETEKYSNDISHYYRVRPGVTGLWQCSGRNDVSYGERVHMDTWYVHNWSVWHDIAIICKTIPTILNRKGAY